MILVFGATGKSGAPVADALADHQAQFKVFLHNPQDQAGFTARGIPCVCGDIRDPASLERAFEGVSKAFYLSPGSPNLTAEFEPVLAAAQRAGVGHFVRYSVIGAHPASFYTLGRWHGAADEALQDSGLPFTILPLSFFMQNFLDFAGSIAAQGAFHAPAGEGRACFIDTRDAGEAVAQVLTVPQPDGGIYRNRTYDLSGPEPLSHGEAAAILSAALGRPIQFINVPLEAARENMAASGMPAAMVDALLDLMENVLQADRLARPSSGVQEITGHAPRHFEQFVADHLSAFQATQSRSQ